MQLDQESIYTKTVFTQSEYAAAILLTDLQRRHLKNELIIRHEQRAALQVDTADITKFIQEEAYLKGQIALLEYQLALSTTPPAA